MRHNSTTYRLQSVFESDLEFLNSDIESLLDEVYANVVRVLAYYDVFSYPLTFEELYLFFPTGDIPSHILQRALQVLADDGRIGFDSGHFFLPHRSEGVVAKRLSMEITGDQMWKTAKFVAGFMRRTPFVRAVFVSGQLSRYIADEKSDIDYFIVTEPGRLWIVRSLFVFIRRTLLLNSRKYFCTNYYVTADNLHVKDKSRYTACEVASLKPLFGRKLFYRFIESNGWITSFFPNFSINQVELRNGVANGRSPLQRVLEALIPTRFALRLDEKLMGMTQRYWRKKFPEKEDTVYSRALRSEPNESRAHPDDPTETILTAYNDSLLRYGVSNDDG